MWFYVSATLERTDTEVRFEYSACVIFQTRELRRNTCNTSELAFLEPRSLQIHSWDSDPQSAWGTTGLAVGLAMSGSIGILIKFQKAKTIILAATASQ